MTPSNRGPITDTPILDDFDELLRQRDEIADERDRLAHLFELASRRAEEIRREEREDIAERIYDEYACPHADPAEQENCPWDAHARLLAKIARNPDHDIHPDEAGADIRVGSYDVAGPGVAGDAS